MGTFLNQGRYSRKKERDRLRLSSAVPKIQWDSVGWKPKGYTYFNCNFMKLADYLSRH